MQALEKSEEASNRLILAQRGREKVTGWLLKGGGDLCFGVELRVSHQEKGNLAIMPPLCDKYKKERQV